MRPFSERPYRRCVGIMLLNKDNLVLVAQRIDQQAEAWQMPQGGVDDGETPRQAALRELEEEIGTDKAEFIAESEDWIPYDLPADLADKVWHGQFRGQTQKWFAMRFLGRDEDINLATAEPEFDAWKWTPMADLADVVVHFKRENYRQVIAAFSHLV
ncbi:MAG: RNA pyrophosphohydrolase [Alphaproteobacteria bacterium]|nr:RNA pyrophosphohydrolase [Alphaproteobacteria bacterium]MDP6873258.1 RNA pyrophosphohydrolase [Alphaproteobacteria bacterium]